MFGSNLCQLCKPISYSLTMKTLPQPFSLLIINEVTLSVTEKRMCTSYWLTAWGGCYSETVVRVTIEFKVN